jgi:hypothetical protein
MMVVMKDGQETYHKTGLTGLFDADGMISPS